MNLHPIIDKLQTCEILSLDIFDTAIVRLFHHPHDVFYFIEKYHAIHDFARLRRNASFVARASRTKQGIEEVTLQDIYDNMVASNIFSAERAAEIMESEKQIELLCTACNPEVYLLYEKALALGKKVIFTSDMYLDFSVIQKILHNAGYTRYEQIFLSNHRLKTKGNKSLYACLLQELGVEPKSILHLGDNIHSDVHSGAICGLNTMQYIPSVKQSEISTQIRRWYQILEQIHKTSVFASLMLGSLHLMSLQAKADHNEKNYWYWNGAQLTVPILLNFCFWLEEEANKSAIKNIFFQARDGLIIKKVFDKLTANSHFKTTYMYSSRKFWDSALAGNNEELVIRYLADICFNEEPAAIVDVGRHGTLQHKINSFLKQHAYNPISGFYIECRGNKYPELEKSSFFYEAPQNIKPFLDFLDFLLIADHSLIIGLEPAGQSYRPIYLEADTNQLALQKIATDMHNAIDSCVDLLMPLLRQFKVPYEQDFVEYMATHFSAMTAEEERNLSSVSVRLGLVDETQIPLSNMLRRIGSTTEEIVTHLANASTASQAINNSDLFQRNHTQLAQALREDCNLFHHAANFPVLVFVGEFQEKIYQKIHQAHPTAILLTLDMDRQTHYAETSVTTPLSAADITRLSPQKTLFIVSHQNSLLLASHLARAGFFNIFDMSYSAELYSTHFSRTLIKDNLKEIIAASKLFNDPMSQKTYWGKLLFRATNNPLYVLSADYPEYFHPLCLPKKGDCIFDAGAFDGDTLKKFWEYLGGHCSIISFEPDPENFSRLCQTINTIKQFKGKALNLGLWEDERSISFVANGAVNASIEGVRLPEAGNCAIKVTSIDTFCRKMWVKPSFIKLDIEGAEQATIRGGKNVMLTHKPKMAICAYHNYDDLWRLPLMVKENNPNYELALGHQSTVSPHWDTVLYAF